MKILRLLQGFTFALAVLPLCGCDSGTGPGPDPGSLRVTTSTTGQDLDSDGYSCRMDGGASEAMGINETVTLSGLTVGSHTIELLDVATNCEVSGHNPRSVVVPHVVTNTTTFNVACAAVSPVFDQ